MTHLPVVREGGLEGSRERNIAVHRGAAARVSGLGSGLIPLSFEMRLFYPRGHLHILSLGAIILHAAVHATLALLPASERLRGKVDAQLSPWLSGCIVLHSHSSVKQCLSEVLHFRHESRGHSFPEPLDVGAYDRVALAMSMSEATALSLKRRLHVSGARCDAGLQEDATSSWTGRRGRASVVRPMCKRSTPMMKR